MKNFKLDSESFQNIADFIAAQGVKYSFQVIGGLVILLAAWVLSKYLANLTSKSLTERKIDSTVVKFLSQLVRIAVMILGLSSTLGS